MNSPDRNAMDWSRRDPLVGSDELGWSIQGSQADVTSTSLRSSPAAKGFPKNRRGTLVVPGEGEWVINWYRSDPTSGSLSIG